MRIIEYITSCIEQDDMTPIKQELIRCKDCQKWQPNFMGRNVCYEWGWVTNSIDYCSRAERREE